MHKLGWIFCILCWWISKELQMVLQRTKKRQFIISVWDFEFGHIFCTCTKYCYSVSCLIQWIDFLSFLYTTTYFRTGNIYLFILPNLSQSDGNLYYFCTIKHAFVHLLGIRNLFSYIFPYGISNHFRQATAFKKKKIVLI
jgi:hypothetical protein